MDQQFELPPDDEEAPATTDGSTNDPSTTDSATNEPSGKESSTNERPSVDPTEGVRIIGAEEAAEAIERGDVMSRRGGNQPRYGDRPPPPPMGPRPTLRFPLDVGADPTRIERPPVKPPPEPVTGPVELPHWTEAPTGDVPQVLIGEDAPPAAETEDDLDAWSSFASSSPRWRDADDSWDDDQTGFVADLAHDDGSRLGALEDPDARPTDQEIFSFQDLEAQAKTRSSGVSRGSGQATVESEARPAPPWAAVPDADDFHDSSGLEGTHIGRATSAEDAQAEQDWEADMAGAAAADSDSTRASAPYDDEDDTGPLAEQPEGQYEEPGAGAARTSRRRRARKRDEADEASGGSGGGGGRDLPTAVLVGLLIGGSFAALLAIGPGWAMALVTVVVFLAAGELFDALRRAGYESATLFGIVGCTAFPLAVYWRGTAAFSIMIVLAVAGCLLWFLVGAGGPDARVVQGVGATLLGIAWVGGFGSFAAAMLRIPDGRALVVIAAVAAVGYDVGGFFIGRNKGQRRLSDVSPNKTVEGLLGGMVVCVVVVVIAVGSIKLGPWDGYGPALALGLAAAVAAPLGDLCQSLIKRDLGVKDMGTILPGHGGILDRFDAVLFVLPTIYYLVTIVGHRV